MYGNWDFCFHLLSPLTPIRNHRISPKEHLRHPIRGIGDEKRGKHVDRVVDVTDEDDDAEHNRYCDAEIPDKWVLPEYERHEEGESGVTRKEEVTGKYEIPEEFGRWCDNLRGKRADVGQADRDGPNEYEE